MTVPNSELPYIYKQILCKMCKLSIINPKMFYIIVNICKIVRPCLFLVHINIPIKDIHDVAPCATHVKGPWLEPLFKLWKVEFIMKYTNDYISMVELLVDLKLTFIFHLSHICEFIGYTNKIILILRCFMKIMGLTFYKHIWKKWPNLQIVEVYRVIIVP
jgi:hypothetical protein